MVTAGAGRADKIKDRRKSIALAIRERKEREKLYFTATGKDKVEYEIAYLENVIYNSKYDLSKPMNANNKIIIRKIEIAEKKLEELKKKLEEYDTQK